MSELPEMFWIAYGVVALAISAYIASRWVMPWFIPYAWFVVIAFLWKVAEPALIRPHQATDLADLLLLVAAVAVATAVTVKRKNF